MSIQNIKDRIPNKVLANGAIRYGVYDENDNLVRYEYIKREDEPIEEGTPVNKILIDNIQGDLYTQDRYNIPEISYGTRVENQTVSGNIFSKTWTEVTEGEEYTADDGSVLTLSGSYSPEDYIPYSPLTGGTWHSRPGTSSWYKIMLPKAEQIETMAIQFRTSDDDNGTFNVAYIEGSNDDSTWTTLYTFTGVQSSAKTVTLNNKGYYKYYRFRCSLDSNYRTQLYKFYPETYKADVTLTTTFFEIDVPLTSYEKGKKVSLKPPNLRAVIGANESVSGVSAVSLNDIIYGNGKYVAVGTSTIFVSEDGETWELALTANVALWGVTYGDGKYVAVGNNGYIYVSEDAITWVGEKSGVTTALQEVTYGNGKFVAVGNSGTIVTSEDAITWTAQTSGITAHLYGVTYGNGKYVVVGNGYMLTSEDAITWASQSNPACQYITYANGKFVAVGNAGYIITSEDAITWTSRTSGVSAILYGVTYGNGKFVVVGASGTILTSEDGVTWTARTSGTTYHLNGVTYGNGKYISVDSNGEILTSEDAVTWAYNNRAVIFNSYTSPRLKIGDLETKIMTGTYDANTRYDLEYTGSWVSVNGLKIARGSFTPVRSTDVDVSVGFYPDLVIIYATYNNSLSVATSSNSKTYQTPVVLTKQYASGTHRVLSTGFRYNNTGTIDDSTPLYYFAVKFV